MAPKKTDRYLRIRVLLRQLQYEVLRGLHEGSIDEHMGFRCSFHGSRKHPEGSVRFEWRLWPDPRKHPQYSEIWKGDPDEMEEHPRT